MWTALFVFAVSAYKLAAALYARRAVRRLSDVSPPGAALGPSPPKLSIIVPARNEEAALAAAVHTMLGQDYPNLEVVLVDDRSTDSTGIIMSELAQRHAPVRFIQVRELPPGWLGKNHALYLGAKQASGEWLLFTDADVHFHPTTCRRAVAFAEKHGLDHLTVAPDLKVRGYWLESWVAFFVTAFLAFKTPYRANNPRSKTGIGVGAFNLIRREAYATAGTHQAISLRPDDDLRLGQRVKRLGLRQHVLMGTDMIAVAWYKSLPEAIRGLEKNAFAGLDYSLPMVVGALAALLAILVWPYLALFLTHGISFRLYLGAVACQIATYLLANGLRGGRTLWLACSFPCSALLFGYTIARSTWLALAQGGIRWRDTFYPLRLLKSQSGLP